jgi:uncharacterized membrane protein
MYVCRTCTSFSRIDLLDKLPIKSVMVQKRCYSLTSSTPCFTVNFFNRSFLVRTIKLLMGVLSNNLLVHFSRKAVANLLSNLFFEGIQLIYLGKAFDYCFQLARNSKLLQCNNK